MRFGELLQFTGAYRRKPSETRFADGRDYRVRPSRRRSAEQIGSDGA
jgi:hypothetical protein